MNRLSKLSFALLFFVVLLATNSRAQVNPIIIQSVLLPPYPVYYSDIATMPGLATVTVQNTDMNNSYVLRFRMKLDGGNGVSILLTEDIIPSRPVKIGPGEVKTLSGEDLADIYHGLNTDELVVTGISEKDVLQSQRIPDGLYRLCVQAFDNETVKPLSGSEPTGCSNKMQILTIEPPVILSPVTDAQIENTNPQQILIRWTAVNSTTSSMLYDIRIAEVPEGVSAYDAMRTDNLLFFEELDYPATVFSYGPAFPALVGGKKYALQITAHSPNNDANIRNNGKSDIVTFIYKQADKRRPLSFNCDGPCITPPAPGSKTPLSELNTGDEVRVGHFHMTILDAHKVGGKFVGEAMLKTSSFFTIPILLEFNDITINANYEVTTGTVYAKQKNELSGIGCYQGEAGFVPTSDADMAEVYNGIVRPGNNVTTYMNDANPSSVYSGVNLPVGYGASGKRMIIIGMYFTPAGATMNMVSGYQMAGDATVGNVNLIYGINNVCVTPGGPSIGSGNNSIVLLNAVDFHPTANMLVRFEPGNVNANTGCWATFGCNGLTNFHIGGTIKLDNRLLMPEDENGNIIPGKSLGAKFRAIYLNPVDFIAPIEFTGTTTLSDVVITPHFQAKSLPHHSLTVQKMYYDNSLTINPRGILFSPNDRAALGDVKTWKGIFIQDFEAKIPDYFNENDTNRLSITAHNFLFDENGYSFSVSGTDVLTKDRPGVFDNYAFAVSSYRVRVVHSELDYCYLNGSVKLDIADSYIDYRGQMTLVNDQPMYFLRVNANQDFFADLWKARIRVGRGTMIKGSYVGGKLNAEANLSGTLSLKETIDGLKWIKITGLKFENLKLYTRQPYFEGGHFDLVGDNGHSFGGFDIRIDSIGMESLPPDEGYVAKEALSFHFRFNLSNGHDYFTTDAKIRLIGKKTGRKDNWQFDSVQVGKIHLQVEAPLVAIEGNLDWYQNDPVYYNGYRGDVVAYFFNDRDFMVESEALFGTKKNMDYYYVDGAMIWSSSNPLTLELMGIRGFGGGAFNNMEPIGGYSPMTLGTLNETPDYHPKKNGHGFKGMIVISTPLDESLFNGIAQIEVEFEKDLLKAIGFKGDYGIMRPLPMGPNADYSTPMISATGTIFMHGSREANNRYFDARLDYKIKIPQNPSLLWGSGKLIYHTDDRDWYLRIGMPSRTGNSINGMVNSMLGLRFKIFKNTYKFPALSVYNYFDFGTKLPPLARYPDYVPNVIRNKNIRRTYTNHNRSGAVMGIHQHFGLPKKKAFTVLGCGVKFRADAGFGLDLGLTKHNGVLCNGSSTFGINNWRANGQGYFYAIASLDGVIVGKSFNITELAIGTEMQAILPEPWYLGAKIGASINLPVYGNYTFRTSFRTGSSCEYTMDPNYTQDVALKFESLIKSIDLSPSDNDSVYAFDNRRYADVRMELPVGRVTNYEMHDHSMLKTRVRYQAFLYEKINDTETKYVKSTPAKYIISSARDPYDSLKTGGAGDQIRIYFTDNLGNSLLKPGKSYVVKIKADLMYAFDNDPYQILKDDKDKEVSETKYLRFATQKAGIAKITSVVSANPGINQRFFYLGENTADNAYYLEYSDEHVFDGYGNRSDIKIEFEDVVNNAVYSSHATKVRGQKKLVYSAPRSTQTVMGRSTHLSLRNGRIYKVKVLVRAYSEGDLGEYTELFSYHFRTSFYDTFADKLNDISISYNTVNASSPTRKYLKLKVKAKEGFGESEHLRFAFESLKKVNGQKSDWHQQYDDLHAYIFANNIRLSSNIKEFYLYDGRYSYQGDLTPAEIEQAVLDGEMGLYPPSRNTTQLEVVWNLNEDLYRKWQLVRNHRISQNGKNTGSPFGKYSNSSMPPYQASPSIGRARLSINFDKTVDINLMLGR